jgi:peptide/nickel transport system substrate-binding protein
MAKPLMPPASIPNATRRSVLGGALLGGAVAAGFAPRALAQTRPIRIGTDVDAQSLDPRTQRDTTGFRLNNILYSGLVQLDASLQPVPDLALSWKQTDPTTWEFTLRPGVQFHDGTKLTAEDVVYTFTTILDPKLNARFRSLYEPIDKIEAMGEDKVRFHLKAPYAPLLSYLDLGVVPKHLAAAGHNLETSPVGSGPFRFVKWARGSTISLAAFDKYYAGKPKIEAIDVVVVADNTARAQALEAGDLDLINSPLSPQDIQRLRKEKQFGYQGMPGISINYLNFNCRNPVLSDPGVRRAVSMLVDQATIVGQIYGGIDTPATSLLLPSLAWSYTPAIRQPAFDPAGAAKALDALGWKKGADGILAKDGKPLAITVSTHSEDPSRVQSVEFLQNTFRGAGIAAQTRITDWPAFIGATSNGNYDLALFGWTMLVDPDRAMFSQLSTGGSLNFGHYSNQQVDKLLLAGRTESAVAKRAEAYQAAARILVEDMPYDVLSYAGFHVFTSARLGGFTTDARGFLRALAAA